MANKTKTNFLKILNIKKTKKFFFVNKNFFLPIFLEMVAT